MIAELLAVGAAALAGWFARREYEAGQRDRDAEAYRSLKRLAPTHPSFYPWESPSIRSVRSVPRLWDHEVDG